MRSIQSDYRLSDDQIDYVDRLTDADQTGHGDAGDYDGNGYGSHDCCDFMSGEGWGNGFERIGVAFLPNKKGDGPS